MRLVMPLIVAGIAGSALMGSLKSYRGEVETIPARAVLDLYHKDEEATRRLIHRQLSSVCPNSTSSGHQAHEASCLASSPSPGHRRKRERPTE